MELRPVAILALLLTSALALAACGPPPGEEDPPHPCDEVWGPAPSGGRIHVDAAGEPGGDGSIESPFRFLDNHELSTQDGEPVDPIDSGLEAVRATGIRSIVLAPGEYPGRYLLDDTEPDWQDSGLEIAGCGRQDTVLIGIWQTVAVGDDDDEEEVLQPVIDVTGSTTAGLVIRDLAVVGGRRGIIVRDSAGSSGAVVLERLDVLESVRLGVLIDGGGTVAELRDLLVDEVEAEPGGFGWGVSIQTAVFFPEDAPAPVLVEETTITGAQGIGLLADASWIEVVDTVVQDTAPSGGLLGRGVQLQNRSWGTVQGLTSTGNSDAAVHLHMPGRLLDTGLAPVAIADSTLSDTGYAAVDGGGDQAADGLSASRALTAYLTEECCAGVAAKDESSCHEQTTAAKGAAS